MEFHTPGEKRESEGRQKRVYIVGSQGEGQISGVGKCSLTGLNLSWLCGSLGKLSISLMDFPFPKCDVEAAQCFLHEKNVDNMGTKMDH